MPLYVFDQTLPSSAIVCFEDGVSLTVTAAARMTPLTAPLRALLADLHREFDPRRHRLLQARRQRQAIWDSGLLPAFSTALGPWNGDDWQIDPVPTDLRRRRVEITGPVNSAKMVIQMLSRNSEGMRADCAMVDFEDSMKPTWSNVIAGVQNVIAAVDGELDFTDPDSGRHYAVDPKDQAKLMVRVRGLHLQENHFMVDGEPISAGLFDLVTVAWHTATKQWARGETPAFYVPKLEHAEEACWWAQLFGRLERALELPSGTLRATFLIETLPAAFQIEEILYELRHVAVGLNVGRWDKIFSDIKVLRLHPDRVLADRDFINLERDWMRNYALRLIRICHLHGAWALGGMAAFTPGRDAETRALQTAKVAADKRLEASWGHDGCWVSHPYFIGHAMAAFDRDNQLDILPAAEFHRPDLLPRAEGPKTKAGLRRNVRVGIAYLHGWRNGLGCVAWDGLMEDLATLEISRASVWQWLYHRIALDDGEQVTPAVVDTLFDEELDAILADLQDERDIDDWRGAAEAARTLFLEREFREFLSRGSEPND